jgi:thiamine-monophosphate kinase
VGELELIAKIRAAAERAGATSGPGVVLGIGDDAAILRPRAGEDLVWTVDDQVEDVHFRRRWGFEAIGAKAEGAALSDLAAMGARPVGALLALQLPRDVRDEDVVALARGLARALARDGCPLVGGNIASRRSGLALSVSAIGAVPRGRALRRDGGERGDLLLVSGEPGLARAGLLHLEGERRLAKPARAVRKLLAPEPRLALGRSLVRRGSVHACVDLSDGLGGDAGKLAAASGCAAVLERARLGSDPELALDGGEDYELLVAAPPRAAASLAKLGLRRVGRLVALDEAPARAAVEDERGRLSPLGVGFDHRAQT